LGILSLIIGLPGLCVALSLPAYRVVGVIAVITGGVLCFFWWLINLPSWTIIEIDRIIEIKEPDGSFATATKVTTMRANHKGLTEFTHRNIRADGTIENFRLDSATVPPSDVEKRASAYIVHERFKATRILEHRTSRLTYDLINSFPSSPEFTGYNPDYYTKKCKVEVHLPEGRTARKARAYSGVGAETKELNSPHLSSDGRTISWEGKRLRPGKLYTVEWDW